MNDDNYLIADDFEHWAYPQGMTARQKFFERVMPWLVFIVIMVLISVWLFTANNLLTAILEPLSLGLKQMGL